MKFLLMLLVLVTNIFSEEVNIKKYFIKSFETENGISKEIESRINNGIFLGIQNLDKNISIINEESVLEILKISGMNQKIGFEDDRSLEKIGNSLKFDGVITGKINISGNQIIIFIKQIQKDEVNNIFKITNSFSIQSYNFQLDYYIKEISQKLINPKYTINDKKAPQFSDTKINLSDIQIVKIENMNLSLYKFKVEDSKLNSLIEGMNIYIQEADDFYKEKNFNRALEIYSKILDSTTNLSADSNAKIKNYISEIVKRIYLTNTNIYKEKIESIDMNINAKQEYSIEELSSFYTLYKEQFDAFQNLPAYSKNKTITDTLSNRMESITISRLSLLEKKGDEYYQSLDFNKAQLIYDQIKTDIETLLPKKKYDSLSKRIDGKKIINQKSAISYLESNLISYSSFAESENSRFILELSMGNSGEAKKRKENAIASLKYLRKNLITSIFSTDKQKSKFNDIANRINENPKKLNVSLSNIALLPVRYIGNIGKGVTDIFVVKFGYGVGVGTQALVFGADGGLAEYPIELSTAYPDKQSELSNDFMDSSRKNFNVSKKGNFVTGGVFYIGKSNCGSGFGLRICEEPNITLVESKNSRGNVIYGNKIERPMNLKKYATVNFWVGAIPAIYMSLELQRIPELAGVIFGQDWDLFDTGVKRFKYFGYEEVDIIPWKAGTWSNYLGAMNWKRAKEHCESIGMVLPTRDDFYRSYDAGVTKNWEIKKDYWTSEIDNDGAYIFSFDDTGISQERINRLEDSMPVRCILR